MSIKVMTHVWDGFPGSGSELLMMLALADRCDEDGGRLWPSVMTLARRCRVSESMARRLLRSLESKGYVAVVGNHEGGKPGTTRQYQLNVKKIADDASRDLPHIKARPKVPGKAQMPTGGMDAHPAESGVSGTPGIHATPRMDAQDGLHGCTDTGGIHASLSVIEHSSDIPKSYSTTDAYAEASSDSSSSSSTGHATAAASAAASINPMSQPSLSGLDEAVGSEPKKAGRAKATSGSVDIGIMAIPSWLPRERLQAFIDSRKAMRKPMTQHAVELLIKELTKIHLAGHDASAAIDKAILNGWMSVYAPNDSTTRTGSQKFQKQPLYNPRAQFANPQGGRSHEQDQHIDGRAERLD